MTNFRVNFDEVNHLITFKDTLEAGETQVLVAYPDGITIDYGRTLLASNDWSKSVLSRNDLSGSLMQGEYTFTVRRYNVMAVSPNSGMNESKFNPSTLIRLTPWLRRS